MVYDLFRRPDLISGTARWRIAASQQSGVGPGRTAATYAPMDSRERVGGLDAPGPDRNLDWERQFFDESEPTVSVHNIIFFNLSLQINIQICKSSL